MPARLFSTLFCCLLALCFGLVAPASQAAMVKNVRSYRAPDYTRLVLDLDDSVEYRVFSLENPQRLVVDLYNSTAMDVFNSLDLSNTPIQSIRSGIRNGFDIRVVFDLNAAVQSRSMLLARNAENQDRLVIDLYDSTPPYDSEPGQSSQVTNTSIPVVTQSNNDPVVSASAQEIANGQRDIVVAIVAGHGGEEAPGAVGINGLQEKQVVLSFAREMEKVLLRTPGYRPVMIRDGDYAVGLRQRIKIAHDHRADLFIAIHADAFTNSRANGATVYALSLRGATSEHARRLAQKENGDDLIGGIGSVSLDDKDEMLSSVLLDLSMTASIASSLEVGDRIISSLGQVTRMRRDNVEQANFVVLRSADIPSLLIEAGYITNSRDARNLNSSAHQKKFANALVEGITSYFYDKPPRGTWVSWSKEHGSASTSYTVVRGDNLSEIAERFGSSISAIKNTNNLRGSTIRIGQVLTIPGNLLSASNQISYIEHTISRGETLSGIAQSYSISLRRIRETNQLNSDTIRIGQTLRIPSS